MAESRFPLGVDLGDLFHDLESVRIGLGKVLRDTLGDAGETVARKAGPLFPIGPGPQSPKDNLPHIGETISGVGYQTSAAVVSSHPAAPVLNYGGTIRPRGVEITFARGLEAQRAYDAVEPDLERELQAGVDALTARYFPAS